MDARLTEALAIIERMCVEHDCTDTRVRNISHGHCTCTLCQRAEKVLNQPPPPACSVCGFTADGKRDGAYYCARCLARVMA